MTQQANQNARSNDVPSFEAGRVTRSQALDRKMRLLWIPGRRQQLAAESYNLGWECLDDGDSDLAGVNFRRVQVLFQGLRPTGSEKSLKQFALVAAAHNRVGIMCLDDGRPADARPSFDRAIEIRRELHRLFPKDRENQVYLGGTLCNRAHSVADSDRAAAIDFYRQSLAILRQPTQNCECSYWDEQRQTWWCEQLEALGNALKLEWVSLAPQFIDNAMRGLDSVEPPPAQPSP